MQVPQLKLTSRTAVIAAVAVVVVGLGGWAFADGGVPLLSSASSPETATTTTSTTAANGAPSGANTDNVAAAVNNKDGKTVVAISIKIVNTDSPTVDPTNAAVAVASCTDCTTVAIALEGVLVTGDPTTFDPTNIALAINSGCTNCQTLASAYQDVVQYDTRVRITGAGRKEIADIRKDLDSLRKSGLDIFAIQQRVNDDAARFLAVLQHDVQPVGKPDKDKDKTAESTTTTTTVAAPSTTTTAPPSTTTTTSTSVPATTSTSTPPTTAAIS